VPVCRRYRSPRHRRQQQQQQPDSRPMACTLRRVYTATRWCLRAAQ
jgi:hypothetical protein